MDSGHTTVIASHSHRMTNRILICPGTRMRLVQYEPRQLSASVVLLYTSQGLDVRCGNDTGVCASRRRYITYLSVKLGQLRVWSSYLKMAWQAAETPPPTGFGELDCTGQAVPSTYASLPSEWTSPSSRRDDVVQHTLGPELRSREPILFSDR
ncbi:hypothetical protein BV20DRAFT_299358 [Pilatotrama ljubarskyi]|nr:hypothetical protein BV20DRAFT_299358 [Pilatotrama ljubarskyi]